MSSQTTKTGPRKTPKTPASPRRKPASHLAQTNSQLTEQFRELRLPMFREHFQKTAERAVTESLSHTEYLSELTDLECQTRRESRIARLMTQSQLNRSKTWDNFDWKRLPIQVTRQMESLRDGTFLSSSREPSAVRQAGLWKKPLSMCVGVATDSAGTIDSADDLQLVGAAASDCQAGLAVAEADQEVVEVRRPDHRLSWATCSKAARRWRCCSRCLPNATNGAACC